ncbi:MAG: UDP-N-acetylmuramate dehydrogenase [Flavisolibacter sp.]
MKLQENISLKPYNTFGMEVRARYFARFTHLEELAEGLSLSIPSLQNKEARLILGGGSNILLTRDFEGTVLKNEIRGITVEAEDENFIYIKAGGGENWHQFVMHCVEKGYGGVENLALIPGSVGASPMQNIGAYGVEIKDVFHRLEAFHIRDKTTRFFSRDDCGFGYRESVFKNRYKDQFVITSVTYKLNKQPRFNTSYGAIRQELDNMGVEALSLRNISQAVINIRSSKLPDPSEVGNAGSFFKNPQIPKEQFAELEKIHPGFPSFPVDASQVKVPAGWLIEQCGWKGYRKGDAGCYPRQALVLVNYGKASGREIFQLSEEILQSVRNKFGIQLEREVNII